MQRTGRYVAVFLLTIVLGLGLERIRDHFSSRPRVEVVAELPQAVNEPRAYSQFKREDFLIPAHLMADEEDVRWSNFRIQKRTRRESEVLKGPDARRVWFDVEHVVLTRGKKQLRFDAGIYSPMGNSATFGFFPFLGRKTPQLLISQDVFRGGCQWVVSLEQTPKIIYDGHEFRVGREIDDLRVFDLDGDGVLEIIVPQFFYDFQDKMRPSQVPSPEIVFKFDSREQRYLPANPAFKEYLIADRDTLPPVPVTDEFGYRSRALQELLVLIYTGSEKEAWEYFDNHYQLPDKPEIEQRVKDILRSDPIYKYVYSRYKPMTSRGN